MRVVVGMSGGVDSAVAAWLLKQQGHDVIGVFMKNWDEKDEHGHCLADQDWQDVQQICQVLDIPGYAADFTQEYKERVFSAFLSEYAQGLTPNPDVLCNREIKFKAFLDFAEKLGADRLATGHFARLDPENRLVKGADSNKDQSYFLYMLRKEQLRKALFPAGHLTKAQIRALAQNIGIPVYAKKDSTGICFIGERNFRQFLSQYLKPNPGLIRTDSGEVVGEHQGLMYYTLGQRKGMGIGGRGDGRSFFVAHKDTARNELIVVQGNDHPLLYTDAVWVDQLTWTHELPAQLGCEVELSAKFRYRQADQPITLTIQENNCGLISCHQPQRAVTPGQSAVFYQGDICLGGGIIRKIKRN